MSGSNAKRRSRGLIALALLSAKTIPYRVPDPRLSGDAALLSSSLIFTVYRSS